MKIENKTVVSALADFEKVTLFFDDGTTMPLPSNQDFTREVVDVITPALAQGKHVTLNMESKRLDVFAVIERKSSGLVRFFRVAKKALLGGGDEPTEEFIQSIALPMGAYVLNDVDETIVAVIQNQEGEELAVITEPTDRQVAETFTAEAEKGDALPSNVDGSSVSAEPESAGSSQPSAGIPSDYRDTSVGHEAPELAPVSVPTPVQATRTSSVVAGAEHLATQMKHFSEKDNPEGFINFMQRIGSVIKDRRHSVDDLLHFLSRGDLPIADDGSIIAYKRLKSVNGGYLVDSHSGKVQQKLGSHVFMDPSMVNPDRRQECSHGLHIGRRDYMGSFHGDTIIICKIAPEDVIAVPEGYGRSKMRCAGYKIVGVVDSEGFALLKSGKSMTTVSNMAVLLGQIIAGNHTPVIETTEIKQNGSIILTPVKGKNNPEAVMPSVPQEALETVENLEDTHIDPELNSPEVIKQKAIPKAPEPVAEPEEEDLDRRKEKKLARKGLHLQPEITPVPSLVDDGMTDDQRKAKANWSKVTDGTMSKIALARECNTSTRSLDRWAVKFNF